MLPVPQDHESRKLNPSGFRRLRVQPLTDAQAADLLEVIEDRAGLRSTIVTSQLPVALWHEGLGEPTQAPCLP